MKYVTGIHALNIPCSLETCGDWHASALRWNKIDIRESDESVFGDWGIEKGKRIPEHDGSYNVANHLRAVIDLMISGQFSVIQDMRDDFIVTDIYDDELFNHVLKLRKMHNWNSIDAFMEKEYKRKWREWRRKMR